MLMHDIRRSSSVKADYIYIKNEFTGEEAVIDRKMARSNKIMLGFMNSVRLGCYRVKMITLTQAVESYQPKHINNFLNCVRRRHGAVVYVWTNEIQEERFKKYGERVLHWHILVAFDWETDIDVDEIKRLQRYWKHGTLKVTSASYERTKYLLKYITKSLGTVLEYQYKIRRIGSSKIEGWLKQSWKRLLEAWDWFKRWYSNKGIDALNDFYWQNNNAYFYDEWELCGVKLKRKILVYRKRRTGWYKVSEVCGEPF